jgi:formiminoglutamase
MPFSELLPYLSPSHFISTDDTKYNVHQIGANIKTNLTHASIDDASIFIVGCGEMRGQDANIEYSNAPNIVRSHFYKMYDWHQPLRIADIGNIVKGNTLGDTRAALNFVLAFLHNAGKTVLVIGGSHDITMCQYHAFAEKKEIIDVSVIDMLIDLKEEENLAHDNFLYPMLTDSPNYIRHFNLMGFQSFYTNPTMIETLDRLHFDCHRLGKVREDLNEMEPILRYTDLMSFDINAVRHSDAPCNHSSSPNGLHGDEACQLARYAGMSDKCCSFGIYGYNPDNDVHDMTARLYSQMMWYFIDGVYYKMHEADFADKTLFNDYHVNMSGQEVLFTQSKRTNRWWMQLPNKQYIPCTRKDYLQAANNEIPERWFREMERSV